MTDAKKELQKLKALNEQASNNARRQEVLINLSKLYERAAETIYASSMVEVVDDKGNKHLKDPWPLALDEAANASQPKLHGYQDLRSAIMDIMYMMLLATKTVDRKLHTFFLNLEHGARELITPGILKTSAEPSPLQYSVDFNEKNELEVVLDTAHKDNEEAYNAMKASFIKFIELWLKEKGYEPEKTDSRILKFKKSDDDYLTSRKFDELREELNQELNQYGMTFESQEPVVVPRPAS